MVSDVNAKNRKWKSGVFALEVIGLALGLLMLRPALEAFLPQYHEAAFIGICVIVAFLFFTRPQQGYKKESPLRLAIGFISGIFVGIPFAVATVIFSAAASIIFSFMFFALPILIWLSVKVGNHLAKKIEDSFEAPPQNELVLILPTLSTSFISLESKPSVPPPRPSLG